MKSCNLLCFFWLCLLVIFVSGDDVSQNVQQSVKVLFTPKVQQVTFDLNPLSIFRKLIDYNLAIIGIGTFRKGFIQGILESFSLIEKQKPGNFVTNIFDYILTTLHLPTTMTIVNSVLNTILSMLFIRGGFRRFIKNFIDAFLVLIGLHLDDN